MPGSPLVGADQLAAELASTTPAGRLLRKELATRREQEGEQLRAQARLVNAWTTQVVDALFRGYGPGRRFG